MPRPTTFVGHSPGGSSAKLNATPTERCAPLSGQVGIGTIGTKDFLNMVHIIPQSLLARMIVFGKLGTSKSFYVAYNKHRNVGSIIHHIGPYNLSRLRGPRPCLDPWLRQIRLATIEAIADIQRAGSFLSISLKTEHSELTQSGPSYQLRNDLTLYGSGPQLYWHVKVTSSGPTSVFSLLKIQKRPAVYTTCSLDLWDVASVRPGRLVVDDEDT